MTDEELDAFVRDFENGTPTPPVDPADIRRMWEFRCKVREEHGATDTHIGLRSVGLPVGIPEASLGALWVRVGLMDVLVRTGILKPWTPGSTHERRVFEVVATFPMRVGEFDEAKFLKEIGNNRSSA